MKSNSKNELYDFYKKIYKTFLVLVVIFLATCSSSKILIKKIQLTPPLKEYPVDDEKYFYIKGISTDGLKIEEAETSARANAYQKIVEMICIRVDSTYAKNRQNNLRDVVEKLFIKGGGFVKEAKVIETMHIKKEIHSEGRIQFRFDAAVIVKYPKTQFWDALSAVNKNLKSLLKSCHSKLNEFKALKNKGRYTEAFFTIVYASYYARLIEGLVVDHNTITGSEMKSMVDGELYKFLTIIDFESVKIPIIVYESDAQNIPLEISITASNQPLTNIPVKFTFTKGSGILTEKAISDKNGLLTSYISLDKLGDYEVNATVTFTFEFEEFPLDNLSKRFSIKVKSLKNNKRIGIIGFFDEGKKDAKPLVLLVNEVSKILSQAKLDITSEDSGEEYKSKKIKENDKATLHSLRNKMNARFIGIIYCQPVSSGVFQKIYHSIISGFFTIVDTSSFKKVYSVSIENIKGYQLSPEKAEHAAINEFRKKLSLIIEVKAIQGIINAQ